MNNSKLIIIALIAAFMFTSCEKEEVLKSNSETKQNNKLNYDKSGLSFQALGNAEVTQGSDGIVVSNIGSTGDDGIEFDVSSLCSLDLYYNDVDLNDEGDFISVSVYSDNGTINPMLKLINNQGVNELVVSTNDYYKGSSLDFKILDGHNEVYSETITPDKRWQRVLAWILQNASDAHLSITFYQDGDVTYVSISGTISFGIAEDPNDGGDFNLPDENVVHGDRAQFVATYRQPTLNQPKFRLMASGTDDVTIHSSNSMSQCD